MWYNACSDGTSEMHSSFIRGERIGKFDRSRGLMVQLRTASRDGEGSNPGDDVNFQRFDFSLYEYMYQYRY